MPSREHLGSYRAVVAIAGVLLLLLALSWTSWEILVRASGEPPVAVDDQYVVAEDSGETRFEILVNDTDPETDTLTIAAVGIPSHGGIAINGSIVISYTPFANFFGTETFTYTVTDGTATDIATVTIAVTAVNDAPIAVDDAVTTPEDTAIQIYVLANDTDPDSSLGHDSLAMVLQPSHGSASIHPAQPRIIYSPTSNWFGIDSFLYQVCDPDNACDTAVVTVTVTPVNDAPIGVDDTPVVDEDSIDNRLDVLINDTDVETDTLTITAVGALDQGGTALTDGTVITYTPATGFLGTEVFTYTVSDGALTDTATVTVTVIPVSESPAITSADSTTFIVGTAGTFTVVATGVPTPIIAYEGALPDGVTFTDKGDGTATLAGTPQAGMGGVYPLTFTASNGVSPDATQAFTLTVNGPPVAHDQVLTMDEDTPLDITLTASDAEGDPLTFVIVSQPAHGTLSGAPPNVAYTPDQDYHGPDSLTFQANDGVMDSNIATVSLTVNSVNDAPLAAAGSDQSVDTNSTVILDGSGSSDIDEDDLTYGWTQVGGTPVTLSDYAAISPSFAAPGDPALITFRLLVTDTEGTPAVAPDEVVITVNNRPPIADAGPGQHVLFDQTVTLDASGSHDPDDDLPLTRLWTQEGGPPVVLSDPAAEAPTFLAPSEKAVMIFTLVVTDALGMPSEPAEVRITVSDPETRYFYLPLVTRRFAVGPDLVVRSLSATANNVTVKIANQGNAPVKDAFWVDVYISPNTVPTAVNQLWHDLGSQGLVWAVSGGALAALVPGGEVTLSVNGADPSESAVSWPILPGTVLYAQVDSYGEIGYGAVLETHEMAGRPYNNISGPFLSTPAIVAELTGSGATRNPSLDGLPTGAQWAELP